VHVDEWLRPGGTVDLGGRLLEIAAVPGHTPSSIALYDRARRQLFAGDFIYPSTLYAFLPGSSRHAYLASVRRLQALVDPDARIYTAHLGETATVLRAPEVGVQDLARLGATLEGIAAGTAQPTGFFPRIYPVHGEIVLATGFDWNNR
jgi:glyoxylase-like metal-dependent hydrolase (beta-lactamase superfamily II)